LPEYRNVEYQAKDFPWVYPPVCHPSTILLIGPEDPKSSNSIINVVLRISKDVKHKSKETSLKIDIPNIECMIEGYQLQILLKYLKQLQEFKQVWKQVMSNLKRQEKMYDNQINIEESRDFDVPVLTTNSGSKRNISKNSSSTMDIFSSVVIAFEEDGSDKRLSSKRKNDFIDSIML
jgi:hypothetical protein